MSIKAPLESLPGEELLRSLTDLLSQSRGREADLVAHIGEVDRRRLFAREAFPSMFAYCRRALHLSEHEAYLRITVARAARRHPQVLVMLGDGRLHLAAIAKLAPHLTSGNRDAVLGRAVHKSKREIEELVAELAPRPDTRAVVRKLPVRPLPARPLPALQLGPGRVQEMTVAPPELGPDRVPERDLALDRQAATTPPAQLRPERVESPRRGSIEPLAAARYKVQFTAGASLCEKLERLRGLMRSEVPDGDLAAIIEKAVTEKLERLEARRHGTTRAPRKDLTNTDTSAGSRYMPAAVRRVVWKRDGGRCRFVDVKGRRCPETSHLEYHHRRPYGFGGDRSPRNIGLMCRAHNRYLAELDYGSETIAGHARPAEALPTTISPGAPSP